MVDCILLAEFELPALLDDLPRPGLQLAVNAKLLVAFAALVLARDAFDRHDRIQCRAQVLALRVGQFSSGQSVGYRVKGSALRIAERCIAGFRRDIEARLLVVVRHVSIDELFLARCKIGIGLGWFASTRLILCQYLSGPIPVNTDDLETRFSFPKVNRQGLAGRV